MKKKTLGLILCLALTGCGKEPKIVEDFPEEPEVVTDVVSEDAVSEDTVSEDTAEASGWGSTPDYFPPEYDPDTAEEAVLPEITHVAFTLNDVSNDVIISTASVINNQPNEDTVHGHSVNGEEPVDFKVNGNLIDQVQTCSDFGDLYSATYDIHRNHLEKEIFTIQTDEPEDGDKSEYIINYYDSLLSAKTDQAKVICMQYESVIELSEQFGDFELMVYPFMDENRERLGYEQLYISGTTKVPTNILLEINGTTIHVISSNEVDFNISGFKGGESFEKQTELVREFEMTF